MPNVASVIGSVSHDSIVTINGNGFESKPVASPLIYEDMNGGSFNSAWGFTGELNVNQTDLRHQFQTNNAHYNFTSAGNGDAYFRAGNAVYQKWFVHYWFKLGTNFDWGNSTYQNGNQFLSNIKVFRMWNPGSTTENFVLAYNGWEDRITWNAENISPDQTGIVLSNVTSQIVKGEWHLFQFEFSDNSGLDLADGQFRAWFDGQPTIIQTGIVTRQNDGGLKRPFIIGFSEVWGQGNDPSDDAPNDFYMSDIYVDNSFARVELCNNAYYSLATVKEIQLPATWTDSSISVKVKQNKFLNGETVYLFVTDENGNRNSIGFEITVGSSIIGGDMTLTFSWNANPENENIINYHLEESIGGGAWSRIINTTALTAMYDVASNSGVHNFRLIAENAWGESGPSELVSVDSALPSVPTGLILA